MADKTAGNQGRNLTPFEQLTAGEYATINNRRARALVLGAACLSPGIQQVLVSQLEGAEEGFERLLNSGAISVGNTITANTKETDAAKVDRIQNTFNPSELKTMLTTATGPVKKAIQRQLAALAASMKAPD